jgi:hypothetical protein
VNASVEPRLIKVSVEDSEGAALSLVQPCHGYLVFHLPVYSLRRRLFNPVNDRIFKI